MQTGREICTFHLGDHIFGIDVGLVQEVLVHQVLTSVPLAPPSVVGVINLRGQIVTTIDLRRRLDLAERPADMQPVSIVVRAGSDPVAFLVDKAGDVLALEHEAYERPPETLKGPARELIVGAYKQPGQLLLVLDAERAALLAGDAASQTNDAE